MTRVKYNPEEDALYWPNGDIVAACEGVDYLREYFRDERDQELGRWRWAENPDYVVYPHPDGDFARVVSEVSGDSNGIYRDAERHTGSNFERAAVAYFAAHPEPKPWHDAKPGEVWHVETDYRTGNAWVLDSGAFMFDNEAWAEPEFIRTARRIWPESEES